MKNQLPIFRLIILVIAACTIAACARPKPEPAAVPLPGITKECPKSDVLKEQYFYVFDPALCQKTNQFLAKANPVALPVPEKAIKLPKDQFLPQPVSGSTSDTGANPSEPVHALTVYFDLNSSVIKAGEAKKLHRFREHVPKTSEIRITGYTCPLGTDAYNQKLAMARAQAVARIFKKHGLQVRSVIGRSGCCFISSTDPSKNRRAEVQVYLTGSSTKHMRGGE